MSSRDGDCDARNRRLLALRPGVVAATAAAVPEACGAAALEAVDEALMRLVAADGYRAHADELRRRWITIATCRLVDEQYVVRGARSTGSTWS
jgi:hypothetical protein